MASAASPQAAPKMRIFRFEPPGLRVPPLVSQRDFLAAMGLEPRVNALLKRMEVRRYTLWPLHSLTVTPL